MTTATRGPAIAFNGVGLQLSGHDILRDVTFSIAPGTIHCVIGPNGSGKTSLIRSLLGQMPHTGTISVAWGGGGRTVGYVPQFLDFDKTLPLTVSDLMAMLCQRRPAFFGLARRHRATVEAALDRVGLHGKRQSRLGSLSGGERQRVLFAQALVPEPALLVLDEPMTSMDEVGADRFEQIIRDLAAAGVTIVWIAHDLAQVRVMADAVTGVNRTIVFSGPTAEVLTAQQADVLFGRGTETGVSVVYEGIREALQGLAQTGTLPDAFRFGFVVNALLCALVIGPVLGGVGTMVVAKRMAFFSQAIGNSAMTGVAIGILLGELYTEPYLSMFAFCILFGLVLNYTKGRTHLPADALIGVFLSISLAIGASLLLFVSARVNTHILEAVLFGSVLTVSDTDMNVLLVVSIVVVAVGLPLFNRLLLASLNPSLARARGVRVPLLEYVFVLMITVLTVACLKIVGAVLVEALLLIPAAAARNIVRSMQGFVFWSMGIATVSCVAGVLLPMQFDLPIPSGGAIIMVAASVFVVTTVIRSTMGRFREAEV